MQPEEDTELNGDIFTLRITAPKQLLLHEEFEAMVWDETLRRAHQQGLIPVGPVLVTTAEPIPEPQHLIEGESLADRMQRYMTTEGNMHVAAAFAGVPDTSDFMVVTATVQIGLSL